MTRILVVPGLAVRGYAATAAEALQGRGFDAQALPAPAEPGASASLRQGGENLAAFLVGEGKAVDLLVGFSVGTQVAAVEAARTPLVRRLLLVSPTVDPALRTMWRLLLAWAASGRLERPNLILQQLPEWNRAGFGRLREGMASAIKVHVEDVLLGVSVPTTIVHADGDRLTSHAYAARLASEHGHPLTVPDATHSWPHEDDGRFVEVVEKLLP